MLPLVLMIGMVAHAEHRFWLENTPQMQSDREVVLADAHLFAIDQRAALDWATWIVNHRNRLGDEVRTYNRVERYWDWKAEIDWRFDCWRFLAEAKDASNNDGHRQHCLYRLRELLGSEAFFAGRMPDPLPQYRVVNMD